MLGKRHGQVHIHTILQLVQTEGTKAMKTVNHILLYIDSDV